MDYQQNQAHVQAFLVDAAFGRLSKNQQEHAQAILQQFNQLMADRHQLDDQHWTTEALSAALDNELYQDGQATYRQVISTVPVLKAYLKFLKLDNAKELAKTLDDHRKNMLASWKNADQKATEPKPKKAKKTWTPESYQEWKTLMVTTATNAKELQNIEGLGDPDKQYLIDEFLTLMDSEAHQWPNDWTFETLQQVLGMTMPLDPHIKPEQITKIVAVFSAFFEYLHNQGTIDDDQYEVTKRTLEHMQPAQEVLASLDRRDRLTQLVLSLAQAEGVDVSDQAKAQKWMANNKTLLASFVGTIMHPWREYDARQENNEMAKRVAEKKTALAQSAQPVAQSSHKKRQPIGISYRNRHSKKLRRKKH